MEETVGKYWHGLITFAARNHYPKAAVSLDDIKIKLGIWFRALGGNNSLRIDASIPRQLGQERTVLQRIAGTNQAIPVASLEHDCLRLPGRLSVYPEKSLNNDLFYWLSALAASNTDFINNDDWLNQNINAVRNVLIDYPGLEHRYYKLVNAYLTEQLKHKTKNKQEKKCNDIIEAALKSPFSEHHWPTNSSVKQFVPLWLYQAINSDAKNPFSSDDDSETFSSNSKEKKLKKKDGRKGEYKNMPKRDDGLLATRLESLFSWSEYVGVDRPVDEGDDDEAERVVDDLDVITLSRDNKSTASRLKFDLDLPSEQEDNVYLGDGVLQPEWDYKKQIMQKDYCSVQAMVSRDVKPTELPKHLYYKSRKLKAQFEKLLLSRVWERAQNDGSELDLEAFVQLTTDQANGHSHSTENLYRRQNRSLRDLCCLLLADVSFSTDAYIDDNSRIIDCIQDSLYLFSEALSLTGDRFAISAFSSKRRNHVRLSWIKHFDEALSPIIRGRIADLRPGYYTRIGAAIRYATAQLATQTHEHKLLLILTDGKPNDLDRYEGRYGIEDTRMAIIEANKKGIHPFCVSIDDKANDYLPYIFGKSSYTFVRNANELPYKLPKLYLKLAS
ncbi:MAG: VWA domain-containing protein [Proteobacteria bacterium]|nr:VWA domain-containing protein [Pseudomonadota bacterium]NOG59915.1 VWA domain-containing protein [Pseudomonadota bacterium]